MDTTNYTLAVSKIYHTDAADTWWNFNAIMLTSLLNIFT